MATAENELVVAKSGGRFRRILIALGVIVGLGGALLCRGALWIHKIDDDPDFDAQVTVPDNASHTVRYWRI